MSIAQLSRIIIAISALALSSALHAAETGGCNSFAWPLTTEIGWLTSSDSEAAATGASLPSPPTKAIALALLPVSQVSFPVAPTGRKRKDETGKFGGFISFADAASPGLYQVTLSGPGWIDVVQGGKTLKPTAHTGKSDCPGARKSLRFAVGSGPFTIEISGAETNLLKFAVRGAE